MVSYTDFDYSKIDNNICTNFRGLVFSDNIYTFDIETTSLFYKDGEYLLFDKAKSPDFYKDYEKIGFMYIWTFSINEHVVFGRTWDEFIEFLTALKNNMMGTLIIFVHNLGWEFQFMRNAINDFEIFARQERHPMYARSKSFHAEFRCSLIITNASLAKVPKMYHLSVEKMVGDLDYNVIRVPATPMSSKNLGYCEHDCLIVYELIKKLLLTYKHVYNIPLTQTGQIRRVCQKMYRENYEYHSWLRKQLPNDIEKFTFIMKAFSGGYTHANYLHVNQIEHNVHSKDEASAYPTMMVVKKEFPVGQFIWSNVKHFEDMKSDYCYIMKIKFTGIKGTKYNHYISNSKCYDKYKVIVDNGRVASAEYLTIYITEIDLDIIRKCYRFDSYEILECLRAPKGRLDRDYIIYTLELYKGKTMLKNVDGMEDSYMQKKQYINALFGMMVTNTITDDVEYNGDWNTHIITADEAEEKLLKNNNKRNTILNPAWGVYVTALGRQAIWNIILQIDKDIVYNDTDSIKYVGDYEFLFEAYNKNIQKEFEDTLTELDISKEYLNILDPDGNNHPMGVFETEKDYASFVTLGAKKYCFQHEKNSDINITLSGVRKEGSKALKNIKDFKKGFVFDYDNAGKKILTYNDCQPSFTVKDDYGNSYLMKDKYGINLMSTTYTIGEQVDFTNYINGTTHYTGGDF